MPFRTSWVHEPHIMSTEYTGYVTAGDVEMNMLEYLGVIQSQEVYILLDFTDAENVPPGLFTLSSPAHVINHGNTRWFAVVSPQTAERSRTTQLLARDRVKLFVDRESGLAFLRAMVRLDTGEMLKEAVNGV